MEHRADGKKRTVTKEAVKRFAARSAKASAQLERRDVPAGYVRSAKVEAILAARWAQG
ncbi:hypothetical protein [Catellatospora citrea]|uniref:hypothetical protein n=1 Tax=Catellatospora citrea TaxID=53366 RepID=UPI001477183A|nr:hypothetical protein [Catellatospora citrea]